MRKSLLLLSLLTSFLGFSQYNDLAPWMENTNSAKKGEKTIAEITASFEEYWKNRDKTKRASGYKPYMRWEQHWKNNTNNQGYLITPDEVWDAFYQKQTSKTNPEYALTVPTSNWVPIGPFQNALNNTRARGRVNVVYQDPTNANTFYIGTPSGGLWKSTNSGTSWACLTDNLPQIGTSGIAVDPNNSNVIYISTGDCDGLDTYSIGVMKSIDGGVTWNTTGLTFTNTTTRSGDIIIDPTNSNTIFCATSVGIYRSLDAGVTWTATQTAVNFSQGRLRFKVGDPTTLFAVSKDKFYRSTNSGATFFQVTTGLPTSASRTIMEVTAANPECIYILSAKTNFAFQGIYRSLNGGTNWTKMNTVSTPDIFNGGTQAWFDLALTVSPTNQDEIYTGCLNIWKSTNGGVAFTQLNEWNVKNASFTHADIHYLRFFGNDLYVGSDGGVYVSSDTGTTFTDKTAEAQIGQFYSVSVSKQTASKINGGTQDNGGFSYNSGVWRGWHAGDGMDSAIDPTNNNIFYGFVYNGLALNVSDNSGFYTTSQVSAPTSQTGNWITPLIINNEGELFSGFSNLYRLSGTSWVQQSTGSFGTGAIDEMAVDPSNDNNMFVSNGLSLYKSTNKGVNFTLVYTAPASGSNIGGSGNQKTGITSIDVHSSNSNIIYLTTSGTNGLALKSIDGGSTFTSISLGLPAIGKNKIVHQGQNPNNPIYVATYLGVYYRDDTMTQFEPFDANLPNVSINDLEINLVDNKIIAATYGRGVWECAIPVVSPQDDLTVLEIISPTSSTINCTGVTTPEVLVKNNGLNVINSVAFSYTMNSVPYNYTWTGTINPSQVTTITLPQVTLSKGAYTIIVNGTTANDAYADNNSASGRFYLNDAGTVNETNTFATATTDLLSYNLGSTTSQWKAGYKANGILATGTNRVYTTSFTGDYPNSTTSYIVSQCYNLSNVSNPQISFKMAFDLETNWDIVYVQYTTDSGLTWQVLGSMGSNWYNSDRTNASSGTANDCQNCPGAQWTGTNAVLTNYSYSLASLSSQTNVMFRIVFISDEAVVQQGVVVDDFLISGTLATETFELNNITIYPNPSKGIFNVAMGTVTPKTVEVYDITGKVVYSRHDFQNGGKDISINLADVTTGVYFVKITSEDQSVVKKIIKK